jgi:hypothetical protein
MNRLIRVGVSLVIVLCVAWWAVTRWVPEWRARELTPVMEAYMQSAASGDSLALGSLSVDAQPAAWGMRIHRGAPAFAAEASHQLRPWFVRQYGDSAVAGFRLRRELPDPQCEFRPLRQVQARFIREQEAWRLVRVGTDIC